MFGERVGYRYSESEDCGIFWSNDPDVSIRQMIRQADLKDVLQTMELNRGMADRMRKGDGNHDH